jgi:hypothetical protein
MFVTCTHKYLWLKLDNLQTESEKAKKNLPMIQLSIVKITSVSSSIYKTIV